MRDYKYHQNQCQKIRKLTVAIEERADRLISDADVNRHTFYLLCLFHQDFPQNITTWNNSEYVVKEVREYFTARQQLIKELLLEGCRANSNGNTGGMRKNELAFDIAIRQCRDVLFLSQDASSVHLIQNIYLMAGRINDLYNASCYYAQKGMGNPGLNDQDLNYRQKLITQSFFMRCL